jgi:hypothetical protein
MVLFTYEKYYFQLKAWLKIQSVTAMEMKNKPKPTGEPQLNHEPHARQFFMVSLWCCSYHSMSPLLSVFSDICFTLCLLYVKTSIIDLNC